MWSRVDLKLRAKQAFRRNYWAAVGVAFIMALVTTGFTLGNTGSHIGSASTQSYDYDDGYEYGHDIESYPGATQWPVVSALIISVAVAWAIFAALLSIFVGNILAVGDSRFFILNQTSRPGVGSILDGFRSGHYGNLVITMFLRDLFVFLWSLLLIIPGIVKSYEYLMIPYILSENPGMDRKEAFAISRRMMNGEKWNAFVLDLSFIGWHLLSAVTCGLVGIFYVFPYREATFAELYTVNRMKAYKEGYIR